MRPDTTKVREIEPEDWASVIAGCLDEQGFQTVVRADGGIENPGVPAAQQEALAVAQFVCGASYPFPEKYSQPLTEAQLSRLYEFWVVESVPCLQSFGLNPPLAPTLAVFLETYESPDMWGPFTVLGTLSGPRYDEVSVACPQSPDDLRD
ncbi:nitrogenase component 1 family protein [Microbacterium gallinarum]|uniref:Uncharacterized protein n=1 Tax=Microbacterium gallinarum TaxID=2762209 RepID=A0ABR8X297_9MICO|nr:hypothetical protein [Microbacterium gallinarum]MBD8023455.1 hypothetical protein [Microbacterium gallinarum]